MFTRKEMKIAVLLFTYRRSSHTEQVLDALKQNTILPPKLLIFQDGPKSKEEIGEWEKVNTLIKAVDWCEKEVLVSEGNRGLAASILWGIAYAFEEYDAVIVLEDDCVPAKNFISFMQQCFEKYRENKKVYSVSGYSYPVPLEKGPYDVYGCGRISSWGWGTWKDRWDTYEKDYEIIRRMKQEEEASRDLAMWGRDLEDMLIGNITGACDSWAVFWALNVIARKGVCVNPYESLIKNIGLDGSGTHCGSMDRYNVRLENGEEKEFQLPEQISILDSTIESFIPLFGHYTAINREDDSKEKILVYGLGNLYARNEKMINEKYDIRAFVDRGKHGWFAGKKIIRADDVGDYAFDKILVMIQDFQECIRVTEGLAHRGVDHKKILTGQGLYGLVKGASDGGR